MSEPSGLDAAADELYSLDPRDFVARRDDLVKQARAARDRPLANAVKALRRPTVGAFYLNLATRQSLTSLVELLQLARDLADAQDRQDAARLRELGSRRSPLERRVLRDLSAHLASRGVAVSAAALEEVRTTLRAALADRAAAGQVASGRLVKPLHYGIYADDDLSSALAAMLGSAPVVEPGAGAEPVAEPGTGAQPEPEPEPAPEPPTAAEPEEDAAARQAREAEEEFLATQRAFAAATARRDLVAAQQRAREASRLLEAATTAVEKATAVVEEAAAALAAARAERDAVREQLDVANALADDARARLDASGGRP